METTVGCLSFGMKRAERRGMGHCPLKTCHPVCSLGQFQAVRAYRKSSFRPKNSGLVLRWPSFGCEDLRVESAQCKGGICGG